ncbi:MAG: V-type ATP synthase subunit I, partial [Treponema sp.]|nr:V-type ATP synthase subunit I [Treponema sp.]
YSEIPGIAPFRLPEDSLSKVDAELLDLKTKLEDTETRIKNLADRRPVLEKEMADTLEAIKIETARKELKILEGMSEKSGISFLKGYIPAEDMGPVRSAAAENGWALVAYDPGLEDEVPTKLKNNRFASMLMPVTEFLGIVPGYRELDISNWFMLFFSIFFGMIFADGGYGTVMVIIALTGIFKTMKTGVPLALKMFLMLSVFSVGWGVVTCSWFGVDYQYLPQFLKNISLPYFSTAKGMEQIFVDQNLMLFCFSLAVIHLTIARIVRIIYTIRDRSLKVMSEIGSVGMIWGMFNVVLFLMVSNERRSFPLLPASVVLIGCGFFLNLVFGAYERNIGQSILDGLKNFISVVLGVTGVFSDIMSYIRLWAVGLAGASISTTVNTMAGPMLGSFLIFAGIILLVFGHGLNMIINVLSVLVHGVRLNILEFSGHVKLNWSGTAYRPFTVKR